MPRMNQNAIHSRREINPQDYVLTPHRNEEMRTPQRWKITHPDYTEVGEYLGYLKMDDAIAAAEEDARRVGARRYQIYHENIGGLHVVPRHRRNGTGDWEEDDERGRPVLHRGGQPRETRMTAAEKQLRHFMQRYGVDRRTAGKITMKVFHQVEDWRERNGLPAPNSPLTRGYLQDLVEGGRRGPRRNPGRRPPPPPRPGRQRTLRAPAAVLPKLRRMIVEEERGEFDPARSYPRETKPHHFAVNPIGVEDVVDDYAFVGGAARAFFVSAWVSGAEEAGHDFSPGTQLDEVAPETPQEITDGADQFIGAVERLNGKPIAELFVEAANTEGRHDREPDPEDFGWTLAMEAMGEGVGWYDDHPVPEAGKFSVPDVEVHVDVDPDDIDAVSVGWFEISERFAKPRGR